MLYYLIPLIHLAGIGSAVFAVMSTRTAQGAIAWVVCLVTFPYLAVPAYWVFGRNKFKGYVLAQQEHLAHVHERLATATAEMHRYARQVGSDEGQLRSNERLARMPATAGNTVELLVDGEATFASILSGIDAAERYVLVQFYIVRDDDIGRQLADCLIARAQAGVAVYFVYDEIGSMGLPQSYLDGMRDAGIDIRPFDTRRGALNRFQLNFRNHRKIVVVDGCSCWIGGHNVGDEYLGRDPKVGNWRDTHVRIDGPATLAAQLSFVEDWHWASGRLPDSLCWEPIEIENSDTGVLVAPSGPADALETASLLHVQIINSARERLWIASPYFVPDEAVIAALHLACLRGVDVRIIIPDKTDNPVVGLATWVYFQQVAPAGARFYRFTDGFLHQKVLLVDDRVAAVGTVNFDNRSFRLNFEITAMAVGKAFLQAMERMFEADFARSQPMPDDAFASKPVWFRFAARLCRLMSPVL